MNNYAIRDIGNLFNLFNKNYFTLFGEMSYRPIVTFSYFLDYRLYDFNPWGYHLTNIFLHAVNGVVLYFVLTLFNNQKTESQMRLHQNTAFISSVLFVSHPILTEAVNAISFREDQLVFLFYMAAFSIYLLLKSPHIKIRKSSSYFLYIASCFLYLIALLSKEMAVTLPLIIISYNFIYKNKIKHIIIDCYNIGYIAILFLYVYIRFYLFNNPYQHEDALFNGTMMERLFTIPRFLINYLKLAFFPIQQCAEYKISLRSFIVSSPFHPLFILPSVFIIAVIGIAIAIRKTRKEISFGIIFFLLTLLPVYNIFSLAHPFAERYFYLPMAGFCLISGQIFDELLKRRHYVRIFVICVAFSVFALYSFLTVNRNIVWKDDYSLWSDVIRKMPGNNRAYTNRGNASYERGMYSQAIEDYNRAIKLNPKDINAYLNRGLAYYERGTSYAESGNYDRAIEDLTKATGTNNLSSDASNEIGIIYSRRGDYQQAIKYFGQAISLNPQNAKAYYNMGLTYSLMGKAEDAARYLEKAATYGRP